MNMKKMIVVAWTLRASSGTLTVGGGSSSLRAVSTTMTGAITIPAAVAGCPVTAIASFLG